LLSKEKCTPGRLALYLRLPEEMRIAEIRASGNWAWEGEKECLCWENPSGMVEFSAIVSLA
jgi:hypothetical protein